MLTNLLTHLGARFLEGVAYVGGLALLGWEAARGLLRGALERRTLVAQLEAIGSSSTLLAVLTVTLSGMVLALYTVQMSKEISATEYVGSLVALSIVRELGPALTAVVVAARAGSAIAAELGTMKISEQIDALRALATDPVEYLVVPRFVAALVALPALTVLSDFWGILGGALVSYAGVGWDLYFSSVQRFTAPEHALSGLIKALVFGAIIALVSCYEGFRTGQGAAAVGRSTTRAVVLSILLVYLANFLVTAFFVNVLNI